MPLLLRVKSGIFFHRRVILSYRAAEAHENAGHFYKTSTKYFGLNQWSISVTGANIGYRIALIMTGKYKREMHFLKIHLLIINLLPSLNLHSAMTPDFIFSVLLDITPSMNIS